MSKTRGPKALDYLKLENPELAGLVIELERARITHLINRYTYKFNDDHNMFLNKEKLMKDIEDGIDYRNEAGVGPDRAPSDVGRPADY